MGLLADVSDACQIKDLDHLFSRQVCRNWVSDACQIKDLDHEHRLEHVAVIVSDACQIKDLDHRRESGCDLDRVCA